MSQTANKKNLHSNGSNRQNDAVKVKKPKPIFIDAHVSQVRPVVQKLVLEKSPEMSHRTVHNVAKTRIYPVTSKDKKTLIEALKTAQFEFHTFSDEKTPTYVLKHFYREDPEKMIDILEAAEVPVDSINFLKDSDNPVYVVKLTDATCNVAKLNTTFRTLDGICVKWELLKQSKKRLT